MIGKRRVSQIFTLIFNDSDKNVYQLCNYFTDKYVLSFVSRKEKVTAKMKNVLLRNFKK